MTDARVIQGDALEVLRGMEAGSVDLLFADPPYGVGKAEWDGEFLYEWLPLAARLVRGCMVVTPGIVNLLKMPESVGELRYRWTCSGWIANALVRGAVGFGNWIPALLYCADDKSVYRQAQDAKRIVIGGDMPPHPSPKPIEFMRWIVGTFSEPGELVCDPFCGSGTTGVACMELGRRFVGIELSENYCAMARRRINAAQPPLLVP